MRTLSMYSAPEEMTTCFSFSPSLTHISLLKLQLKIVLSFLYPSAPQEISGHTSAIKKALWCNNDKQILSAAEDKTIRSVMLHESCSDLSSSVQKLKKYIYILFASFQTLG